MILLLCHLFGDYVLQSHVMATRKTSSMAWALIHATFYTMPFAVLVTVLGHADSVGALALFYILTTHAIIDRYALAAKWCRWYGVGHPGLWWRPYSVGEMQAVFAPPPPFIGAWLTIIVDNTFHLAINAAAIYFATGWIG